MSDIPPGGQTGWAAMDHKQLHDAVNDPAGDPGASMAAEEAWARVGTLLDASYTRIRAAVGRSAEDWLGVAATAARAAFDPLHLWTGLTVDDVATVAAQLTDQSFHAAELRRKLPPPVNEDEVRAALIMQGGQIGILTVGDDDVAQATAQVRRNSPEFQHAVQLMSGYQHDSDRRAGVLDIRTQPPEIVVQGDSTPTDPMRVSGGPGGPGGAVPAGGGPSGGGPSGPVLASGTGPAPGPAPVVVPPPVGAGRPTAVPTAPVPPAPRSTGPGSLAPTAPGPQVAPQVRPDAPVGRPAPGPGAPEPTVPPAGARPPGGLPVAPPGRTGEPALRPAPPGRLDPRKLPPGFGGRSPGAEPVPLARPPGIGSPFSGGPTPGEPGPKDWRELVRADGPRGAAVEPAPGGARPTSEPRAGGTAMYPPMTGAGAGGGAGTRRRPGYLLGDGGYFRDDRWFPPAVITQDDPLPGHDDPPSR